MRLKIYGMIEGSYRNEDPLWKKTWKPCEISNVS